VTPQAYASARRQLERRMRWEEQLTDFERWEIATGRPRRMPDDFEMTDNESEEG
jgi:hypothetical protein